MKHIGLDTEDIENIRGIFTKHPQIEKVFLLGSRAMGNYKPYSDIDMTLLGDKLNLDLQQEIETELDDLLLPYKFDLSLFDKITNNNFIHHINKFGIEFYRKK